MVKVLTGWVAGATKYWCSIILGPGQKDKARKGMQSAKDTKGNNTQ